MFARTRRRWPLLILVALITVTTGTSAHASQDTAGPELAAFSIEPATVDASNGPVAVTFTLRVTDDLSGFHLGSVNGRGPTGQSFFFSFRAEDRVSGNAQDGTYRPVHQLPQYSAEGVWTVHTVQITDTANNNHNYTTQQLTETGYAATFLNWSGPDVAISVADSADPVGLGDAFFYTASVINNGLAAATDVSATVTLASGDVSLPLVVPGQGTCTAGSGSHTCALGSLAAGATAIIWILAEPLGTGGLAVNGTVTMAGVDPVTANNAASQSTVVNNSHGCTMLGTPAADTLTGTSGDDVICGFGGGDVILAGSGDDVVYAGTGDDTVNGQDGNDVVFAGTGADTVNGQNGDDLLAGEAGNDTLNGQDGSDILNGATENDTLNGQAGDDYLIGANGDDTLIGYEGADTLVTGAGTDIAHGGPHTDTCSTDPEDTVLNCP